MRSIPTISIIGGGFSGAATVIHLIRNANSPLNIILINKDTIAGQGIAFNSYNNNHLLNVRVINMSPFDHGPLHFAEWISKQDDLKYYMVKDFPEQYVSRNIFGKYMAELLRKTIAQAPKFLNVKIINDEVLDLIPSENNACLILSNEQPIIADKVVFALGNFLPANIRIDNPNFYNSSKYYRNPWSKEAVKNIYSEEAIFMIGTGLTMVDNVVSLIDRGYNGKIYALSKNGYLPLPHTARKAYHNIQSDLIPGKTLLELFTVFKKHFIKAVASGHTYADVIDAVRPDTQQLWLGLSLEDKKKFIRHLSVFWNITRHRLPAHTHDKMQQLISNGQLRIIAGNLIDMVDIDHSVSITIRKRKTDEVIKLFADRVINCTGPQTDIRKIDNPLIKNLVKRGVFNIDEVEIGINANEQGQVIDNRKVTSELFYLIGSMRRGQLWESSAVPELRQQAEFLSKMLIQKLQVKDKKLIE